MKILHDLKDVSEACRKLSTYSLPTYKENYLRICFSDNHVTNDVTIEYIGQKPQLPFASSEQYFAEICDWRRLTDDNEDCKAVYELTLDNSESNFIFRPGDTIGVISQNVEVEVDEIISHLKLQRQADIEYELSVVSGQKGAKVPPHVPVKSTVRHVLKYCLDIRCVLKKLFILALSRHTADDTERRSLEYLCSKEGSEFYSTHIVNKHFCLLDLLSCFQSCKPNIETLLSHLPRLLPRPYSIANSYVRNKNVIKICFSVINEERNRKGLVTGWLENIITNIDTIENKMEAMNLKSKRNNLKVPIYLRKNMSGFALPKDLDSPMILVGPGTGVAPFIGFLEEIQAIKEKHLEKCKGELWLVFGCRNPGLDYIYEKELKTFLSEGVIDNLLTTFSRAGNECKYVQDALLQNGKDVIRLIKKGALIYVCGDLKNMGTQVRETFVNLLIKYDNKSKKEAEQILSDMQLDKKYLVDIWS